MAAGWAAGLGGACGALSLSSETWCACAKQCSPVARLFGGCPSRVHVARADRGRARRIYRDAFLHDNLCLHADRRFRRGRLVAPRNRRRRSLRLCRVTYTLAFARGVHGDLPAVPRRVSTARRILRKILSFQRRDRAGPNHGLLWLVVLALFGSLISLYYYLIVLKMIFVNESTAAIHPSSFQPFLPRIVVSLLAILSCCSASCRRIFWREFLRLVLKAKKDFFKKLRVYRRRHRIKLCLMNPKPRNHHGR